MDSRYSTLRSGPPPPPKPLHLTVSRGTKAALLAGDSSASSDEDFFSDPEQESVLGTLKGVPLDQAWEGTVKKQREMWENKFAPSKKGVIGGKTGGAQRGVGDLRSLWDKVEVDVDTSCEQNRKGKGKPVGKRRETIWDQPTSPTSPVASPVQELTKSPPMSIRIPKKLKASGTSPFKDLFAPLTSPPKTSPFQPASTPQSANRDEADADAEEDEPRTIKLKKRNTMSRRERYASSSKGKGVIAEKARKSVVASIKKRNVRDTIMVLGDLLKEMQALDSDTTFTNPPSPELEKRAISPTPISEEGLLSSTDEDGIITHGRQIQEDLSLAKTNSWPKTSFYSIGTETDEDGYATAPQSGFTNATALQSYPLSLNEDFPPRFRDNSIFPEDSVSNFRAPKDLEDLGGLSIAGEIKDETATDLISDLVLEIQPQTHPLLNEDLISQPSQVSPGTQTVVLPTVDSSVTVDLEVEGSDAHEHGPDSYQDLPHLQSLQSPARLPVLSISTEHEDLPPPRPARALFSFSGEPSFGELSFLANKTLQIEVENLGGGWSLGYVDGFGEGEGERGLIPRGWYSFIQEMKPPALSERGVRIEGWLPGSRSNSTVTTGESASEQESDRQASGLNVKHLVSSLSTSTGPSSVPIFFSQNTTPDAACFQPSLEHVHKKSRASQSIMQSTFKYLTGAYVPGGWEDSGAESWVKDAGLDEEKEPDSKGLPREYWWIEQGPIWREVVACFEVDVHSPSRRAVPGQKEYTIFQVSSEYDEEIITVERRFNDFVKMHNILTKIFETLVVPPLPSKQYTGRFRIDFVEARRRDLRTYLRRLVRHPVLRASEVVKIFLEMEDRDQYQEEIRKLEDAIKAYPKRRWMVDVNHPDFNIDPTEAKETLDRFTSFVQSVERGGAVKEVIDQAGLLRASMKATSNDLRLLAHKIVKMSSGLSLPRDITAIIPEKNEEFPGSSKDELEQRRTLARKLRLQNDDGAWCWKEKCDDCLSATKALQESAEATEKVAQLYEQNAASALLSVQEVLRDFAYPYSHHAGIIDIAQSAINLEHEIEEEDSHLPSNTNGHLFSSPNDRITARNETILNISLSEISRSHTEHSEDMRHFAKEYLDSQIEFHQKALLEFSRARLQLEDDMFRNLASSGPRLPSLLERTPKPPSPLPELTTYRVPAVVGATKKASVMESILPGSGLVKAATSRSFFS